jgi:hypothetical protein
MDMTHIETAASLIAEFSVTTAAAFRSKPFHRMALAQAFESGFKRHSDYSRKVCAFVLVAAKLDRLDRSIGAA